MGARVGNTARMDYVSREALDAALDTIRDAPKDGGELQMIVRRPEVGEREVLQQGELDEVVGLVGDTWQDRPSSRSTDGNAHPDMQLNIMNSRATAAIAGPRERWPLAGDQLYIDMDISTTNLPAWTKLSIGTAIIQVTDQPHTGCAKFNQRFGSDSRSWVNHAETKDLNLRGINAKVIQAGTISEGDTVTKLEN